MGDVLPPGLPRVMAYLRGPTRFSRQPAARAVAGAQGMKCREAPLVTRPEIWFTPASKAS